MRSDRQRLEDIRDCIAAIRRYTSDGRARFDSDELVRVWCLRHIEIIGEAAANVSAELRERYDQVPWRPMVAMRNVLIHGYSDVKDAEVWNVIAFDLKPLSELVEQMLLDV